MANYTDETVPVKCWECTETPLFEGIGELERHLTDNHNFVPTLAAKIARNWADDVYERIELWDRMQCGDRRNA